MSGRVHPANTGEKPVSADTKDGTNLLDDGIRCVDPSVFRKPNLAICIADALTELLLGEAFIYSYLSYPPADVLFVDLRKRSHLTIPGKQPFLVYRKQGADFLYRFIRVVFLSILNQEDMGR